MVKFLLKIVDFEGQVAWEAELTKEEEFQKQKEIYILIVVGIKEG